MAADGVRPHVRILHTSDVHLGAHDSGGGAQRKQREEVERNFARLIDIGHRERVDLFLIAGDFFDNARVHDDTLRFAAEQIARIGVPTILLPGNHDHGGIGGVYDRLDFAAMAPNLTIMRETDGGTVVLESLGVAVWGRSHEDVDGANFFPFVNVPPRSAVPWHIGIGHGHYMHPESGFHPSYHIREEHLVDLELDYVALGHWDRQVRVSAGRVVAAYSGAPHGLGGTAGRTLIVDLQPNGAVELTSISLGDDPPIQHDEIPIVRGGDPASARWSR